jgi:prevent-host-death family protein
MDDYRPHIIKKVGAYEAKTNLPAILDQVERGVEYVITRHGKEVAHVVPAADKDGHRQFLEAALKKSDAARVRCTLGGISWKELRDAGRRFLD